MIKSMTGYGKASMESDSLRIQVEIRSLNSKFLDLVLRIPKEIGEREVELRKTVSEVLERGKVNVSIEITRIGDQVAKVEYDSTLFESYYTRLKELADQVGAQTEEIFKMALQSPEVVIPSELQVISDQDWNQVQTALNQAFEQCDSFRAKEGAVLKKNLEQYLAIIGDLLDQIEQAEAGRMEALRQRLTKLLNDNVAQADIDQNRFEQELIYYLERLDISEEKDRLKSHLNYFREILEAEKSQGKKLGFISQEMGREINTIGSKANQAEIQKLVVGMKDELEKIKEQLFNIL